MADRSRPLPPPRLAQRWGGGMRRSRRGRAGTAPHPVSKPARPRRAQSPLEREALSATWPRPRVCHVFWTKGEVPGAGAPSPLTPLVPCSQDPPREEGPGPRPCSPPCGLGPLWKTPVEGPLWPRRWSSLPKSLAGYCFLALRVSPLLRRRNSVITPTLAHLPCFTRTKARSVVEATLAPAPSAGL